MTPDQPIGEKLVTPEELVGERIREAREDLGLTQKDLGEYLGQYLGSPWQPQAVWAAEQGTRKLDPTELLALAHILEQPIPWFFLPQNPDDAIYMPGDIEHLSGKELLRMLSLERSAEEKLVEIQERLNALQASTESLSRELQKLRTASTQAKKTPRSRR